MTTYIWYSAKQAEAMTRHHEKHFGDDDRLRRRFNNLHGGAWEQGYIVGLDARGVPVRYTCIGQSEDSKPGFDDVVLVARQDENPKQLVTFDGMLTPDGHAFCDARKLQHSPWQIDMLAAASTEQARRRRILNKVRTTMRDRGIGV